MVNQQTWPAPSYAAPPSRFFRAVAGALTFWCRLRKSAKAAEANGEGLLRPLSQFCSESSVIGNEASLKTFVAWAWLSLFLTLHSLSRSITGERGLGIATPFSQMEPLNARAESIGCSRLSIVKSSDLFEPLPKGETTILPINSLEEINA